MEGNNVAVPSEPSVSLLPDSDLPKPSNIKTRRRVFTVIAVLIFVGILTVFGFMFLPKIVAENKQLAEEIAKEEAYRAETAEVDAINEALATGTPFDHTVAINTLKSFIIDHLDRPEFIYAPLNTLINIYRSDQNFAEAETYVEYVAMKVNSATVKIDILRTLEASYIVDGDYSALVRLYTQIVGLAPRSDLTAEERTKDEERLKEYQSHV